MSLVKLYDTTLRDGTQAEDISFLVEDKIRIAHKLDELGVHYIEGGWPGSNPKDVSFLKISKRRNYSRPKLPPLVPPAGPKLPLTKTTTSRP